jgi:hypothetical protein
MSFELSLLQKSESALWSADLPIGVLTELQAINADLEIGAPRAPDSCCRIPLLARGGVMSFIVFLTFF